MENVKNHIFTYKTSSFEDFEHNESDTCEDVIKYYCQKLQIAPVVQLLFGLRIHSKNLWLAGCRQLKDGEKYEFRIRFKIPKISDLNKLDKAAYDYFYHQVRYDVLNNNIPEIKYPQYKNDILGLCVTDMYVEMIEKNKSVEDLLKSYKNYIPKELFKNHKIFAKKEIENSIKGIKNKGHDAFYVKGIYLQQIDSRAPNYLTEEYSGTRPYLEDQNYSPGTCTVKLKFTTFPQEEPGLSIYYADKRQWCHLSKIGDFYTITVEGNEVSLEIQNNPSGCKIKMQDRDELESFVSCISCYYRLMVKWNVDLCQTLASPTLKFLTELKIHGPIGGAYSYNKIEEKDHSVGSFIIRQCEKIFDSYYIDIVTKENQPETFKIFHKNEKWHLVVNEKTEEFDNLIELAKSIKTENKKWFRLPPTIHDKSPLLLLCLPQSKLVLKESVSLRSTNPLVLRATDDLLIYKWSQKDFGDGIFATMKAEYKQSNHKKINVTLKILKSNEVDGRLTEFMRLADQWAKLDLQEIIKLYGVTLCQPISLVLESMEYGPLDEFLRARKKMSQLKTACLVEAAYSLARALHYLQENQITHGKIRCSTLQVVHFQPHDSLTVKLGDPGLVMQYTEDEIPWIPIEDYDSLEGARKNLKADIWAYATTLWQIFSRGSTVQLVDPKAFFISGDRPSKPIECNSIPVIYDIMLRGWERDPDRRFSPQSIFAKLLTARTLLNRDYAVPLSNGHTSSISQHIDKRFNSHPNGDYGDSMKSIDTENTYVPASEISKSVTERSQSSLMNGHTSLSGSRTTLSTNFNDDMDVTGDIPSCVEVDKYRLIFQGAIGEGNYGSVFRGLMISEDDDNDVQVAIKLFRNSDSETQFRDFQREAKIMKTLDCENIVKILGFLDTPRFLIIMEYIEHKSLLLYVQHQRPNLTVDILLNFAKNMANGMHYLERKNIVHRDLAARNVLVASEGCVKIADFGLAQFTDNTGYYHFATNKRALPLKWYAPETLKFSKFSHKSDVWSYGVTIFEMFTFGESPNLQSNSETNADEILNLLEKGVRLHCPPFCPKHIYDSFMFKCWNINPKLRPNFAELLQISENLLNDNGENV